MGNFATDTNNILKVDLKPNTCLLWKLIMQNKAVGIVKIREN